MSKCGFLLRSPVTVKWSFLDETFVLWKEIHTHRKSRLTQQTVLLYMRTHMLKYIVTIITKVKNITNLRVEACENLVEGCLGGSKERKVMRSYLILSIKMYFRRIGSNPSYEWSMLISEYTMVHVPEFDEVYAFKKHLNCLLVAIIWRHEGTNDSMINDLMSDDITGIDWGLQCVFNIFTSWKMKKKDYKSKNIGKESQMSSFAYVAILSINYGACTGVIKNWVYPLGNKGSGKGSQGFIVSYLLVINSRWRLVFSCATTSEPRGFL